VSRVRENRMHGSTRRREETGTSRASTSRTEPGASRRPDRLGAAEQDACFARLWVPARTAPSWVETGTKLPNSTALRTVRGAMVRSATATSAAGGASARHDQRGRASQTATASRVARVGARQDHQAGEYAGHQCPAIAVRRAPVLDRGGQSADQRGGAEWLGGRAGRRARR
jgi:hypothetical protein